MPRRRKYSFLQQTLSIRISEALREFLERSRKIISNGRGESVSASDVAKMMLESAKDDRLDFRLEVAELQESATKSMWAIRRKWEQRRDLSRADWTLLAQYIQVACEEVTEDPAMPPPQAFAVLLEAMLAVRKLRVDRGVELDRYYLGNLGVDDGATFNERQLDPDIVPRVVAKLLHQLRESPGAPKPTFAGCNLYVTIRDEEVPDIVALNVVLFPPSRDTVPARCAGPLDPRASARPILAGRTNFHGLDTAHSRLRVPAHFQRKRLWRLVDADFHG